MSIDSYDEPLLGDWRVTENTMPEGGCNCGQLRYTLASTPLAVAVCHCTSCRRQSGAAFSVNIIIPAAAVELRGDYRTWLDHDTESGQPVSRQFCPLCGSPVRSLMASAPHIVAIKAGTLDKPEQFAPSMHIWTRSALPWVMLPNDMPCFAQGPQT